MRGTFSHEDGFFKMEEEILLLHRLGILRRALCNVSARSWSMLLWMLSSCEIHVKTDKIVGINNKSLNMRFYSRNGGCPCLSP